MNHSRSISLLVFVLMMTPISWAQEAPAPAVQPLGNLTKEMPEERYEHLKEAKTKVDKFRDKGNLGEALQAQRESLRIAQEEFGGNKLIMLEEMLVLTDLLQQQKESEEAGEILIQIDTLMDSCSECPVPFLEGLRKRADELRGGTEDKKNETIDQ